jgi:hypothetical protein
MIDPSDPEKLFVFELLLISLATGELNERVVENLF